MTDDQKKQLRKLCDDYRKFPHFSMFDEIVALIELWLKESHSESTPIK